MIRFFPDYEALSQAAAEIAVQSARRAIETAGRFSIVLSGGNTPRRTYELLARAPFRDQIQWDCVHVFWGDERCVPPDDPRSNELMARGTLLDHVPIPPKQIHPMRCEGAPEGAARGYAALLERFWGDGPSRFDLVLLGLGPDGHTASLFPGTQVVFEKTSRVAAVAVPGQPFQRVTLTAPTLNEAAQVVFLVTGASKAAVLKDVLEGDRDPGRLPAQLIRPVDGELTWLVDEEAGRLLKRPT